MDNNPNFATTQWSVVRAAAGGDSREARSALEALCELYWYPLYTFVRRKGYESNEAEDLTQAFFADLLAREDLRKVQPELGRFRSFLLAALKNFLLNQWDRSQAQKRGGGRVHLSLDFSQADSQYRAVAVEAETPDSMFERQWALTLLGRVNSLLKKEYENRGKAHVYERLAEFLAGKSQDSTQTAAAAELGMSEVAVKVALHRMRARFGDLLRAEIRETVNTHEEIEDEIAHLFSVLRA
ncbi:MAG: RNA polymerase sigma factor [Pirellulaceae bacterium]